MISLEIMIAHSRMASIIIFQTSQTVNQGPHKVVMELLFQVEVKTRVCKRASTDPWEEWSPEKNSGLLKFSEWVNTAYYSPHSSRNRERDGSLPGDAGLFASIQETETGRKWFLWRSERGRVTRDSRGQCLGTYSSTAHKRVAESWRAHLVGHWASHR